MTEMQDAWVVRVLQFDPAVFAAKAPPVPAGAVSYAKSRLAWLSMRSKLAAEVDLLVETAAEQYEDEGNGPVVRALLRGRIGPVLATFDDTLADTLDAATNETDPDRRKGLVADARAIIERYQAYVEGEEVLAAIDQNPFTPTAIRKTVVDTLQALSSNLH